MSSELAGLARDDLLLLARLLLRAGRMRVAPIPRRGPQSVAALRAGRKAEPLLRPTGDAQCSLLKSLAAWLLLVSRRRGGVRRGRFRSSTQWRGFRARVRAR